MNPPFFTDAEKTRIARLLHWILLVGIGVLLFDTIILAVFIALAFWAWLWGPMGGFLASPLLIVNSENLNFVDDEQDYELLLARIRNMRGGREFFSRGE